MKTNTDLTIHPQAENYRNQNRHLQTELARLIARRDDLKYSVAPNIETEYRLKLGALEWRVFQLDCETRAMIRRIEMAQAALNRGEEPSYEFIEREIKTEFAAWREKIEQKAREIETAKQRENLPRLSRAETRELQTVYRKLAFLLHPDIVGNPSEKQKKFWLQTVEAYKNGDLQTLRTIRLLAGAADEDISGGENALENLRKRNEELKQACEKTLDEINEIHLSEPFVRQEILASPAEIARRQKELHEQIAFLREQRRLLADEWAEIMRFAKDRAQVEIPDEPPDLFGDLDDQSGFDDDWAEIIYER